MALAIDQRKLLAYDALKDIISLNGRNLEVG